MSQCEKCGRGFFRAKLFNEHKCQPGRSNDSALFKPRRRRKIGRPRKRDTLMPQDAVLHDDMTGVEVKRHHQGTPGLRSASGIHLQNARVAAAIANQMKGTGRVRGSKGTVEAVSEERLEPGKVIGLEEQEGATPVAEHLTELTALADKQLVPQVRMCVGLGVFWSMSIIWIYVVNRVCLVCWPAVLRDRTFNAGHYMQTVQPIFFHTCRAYRHYWLLPFYTAFTDLDLAWGDKVSAKQNLLA